MNSQTLEPAIGVIGGSGLYEMEELEVLAEHDVETGFGKPSDVIIEGRIGATRAFFLPRHGRGHRLLPTELNHRANILALRMLGVRWIISVSAVGSLQEKYRPRDVVIPDQFFDRMSNRSGHTLFGKGVVGHIAFDEPFSSKLRAILRDAASEQGATVHFGGTYVNMDGPAFSTRAESRLNHTLGFDVVGMTNLPEAKLAREAEIAYASLCMVTDYDSWHQEEAPVNAATVIEHLMANARLAQKIVASVLPNVPRTPDWPEHTCLDCALITPAALWPAETVERLRPVLGRFVS
jgi:5'-methylthioadenosine phosphorylase